MLSYLKKLFHQQSYVASALQASDQKGCGKRAYQKASVTVEAAFVFPMFLFLMMILLIPLRIMRAQRRMHAVVESVCKDCASMPMQSILCCRWQAVHWMEFLTWIHRKWKY